MAWLLNLALLAGLSYWIYQNVQSAETRPYFWPALVAKLLAGIGLGWLYTNHYRGGDTLLFLELAQQYAQLVYTDINSYRELFTQWSTWIPFTSYEGPLRSEVFCRWLSLPTLLAGGNYWILSLWCSWLSFLACFYLVKQLAGSYPTSGWAAALAFLFWPSLVFWSSGVLKESLCFAAFTILLAIFLKFQRRDTTWPDWLLAIFALLFLTNIKYYVALPLALALAVLVALRIRASSIKLTLIIGGLVLIGGWLLSLSHPYLHPQVLPRILIENYNYYPAVAKEGSLLVLPNLAPNWFSLFLHSPLLAFNGLFLPLPLLPYRMHLLQLVAGLENFVWLGIASKAVYRLIRGKFKDFSASALVILLYGLFMATTLSVASPVYGSLLRYRIFYLPLLIYLALVYLFPRQKLAKLSKVRSFATLWKTQS